MAVRGERAVEVDIATPLRVAVDRIIDSDDHVDVVAGDKPVAVIVSTETYRRLKRQDDALRQELHDLSVQISRAFADVPDDELERELEKARVEYRAEKHAE